MDSCLIRESDFVRLVISRSKPHSLIGSSKCPFKVRKVYNTRLLGSTCDISGEFLDLMYFQNELEVLIRVIKMYVHGLEHGM